MKVVIYLMWTCLGLAGLIPAMGISSSGYWYLAFLSIIWLFLWVWGFLSRRQWVVNVSFLGLCLELATGEWLGMGIGWSVISMTLALAAWDLFWFSWRFGSAEQIIGEKKIITAHLLRLLGVVGIGLALVGIALAIRIKFGFGVAILLSFLVVFGLRQWILITRRSVY